VSTHETAGCARRIAPIEMISRQIDETSMLLAHPKFKVHQVLLSLHCLCHLPGVCTNKCLMICSPPNQPHAAPWLMEGGLVGGPVRPWMASCATVLQNPRGLASFFRILMPQMLRALLDFAERLRRWFQSRVGVAYECKIFKY
jgi:hypothetical protein